MKIAQVINSNSWGEITPQAFQRGIGGREGAMVRLATEWARMGHEVTNFVSVKKASRFDEEPGLYDSTNPGFHEYIPTRLAKPMLRSFPFDAVVAWECPSVFDDDEILEKQKVRLLHMQVAHLEEREYVDLTTGVVALSNWAKEFLQHDGIHHQNFYVRPNGIDLSSYPFLDAMKNRRNLSMIYSSSPDRGLLHILEMWRKIRKIDKKASLKVAYGVSDYIDKVKWSHNKVGEMAVKIGKLLDQPGITDVGKIGQDKLAKIQLGSSLWVYPADTIQATETGCITALENMAAGNPCIMSDADCLESEFSSASLIRDLPFDKDKWIETINLIHNRKPEKEHFRQQGRNLAAKRDWRVIAPQWIDLFEENNASQ